jgi:hypothetical protein
MATGVQRGLGARSQLTGAVELLFTTCFLMYEPRLQQVQAKLPLPLLIANCQSGFTFY